jgi:hypothetical protein
MVRLMRTELVKAFIGSTILSFLLGLSLLLEKLSV